MNKLDTSVSIEQKLHFTALGRQVEFFIKRDDLIHPFISGNKWRKLKYYLSYAETHGKNKLVTFGGAFSNHLLATACAGAVFGYKTKAFVRGEEIKELNHMLTLCKLYGMELEFVTREAYRQKDGLYADVEKDTLIVPEGGYGELALQGCAEIADELTQGYDYIVTAVGTGATLAGLVEGVAVSQPNCKVIGVSALKGAEYLNDEIKALIPDNNNWELLHNYHHGGYAKTSPELIEFLKTFTAQTGVLIDPVYTAKTAYAITDLCKQNYFKPNSKVLMLHTGGLIGLMSDKFTKILGQ